MLPPFIIEQIRKREEEAQRNEQPTLELPLPPHRPRHVEKPDEDADRGVLILDIV